MQGFLVIFALFIIVLSAGPSAAQISVRSGEHESFSRLVFLSEIPLSWEVEQIGSTGKISFDGPSQELDLSRVFERIPRSRLLNISGNQNTIQLDLACPCVITSFSLNDNTFVIDVEDPTALNASAPRMRPVERVPSSTTLPLFPNPPTVEAFRGIGILNDRPKLSREETIPQEEDEKSHGITEFQALRFLQNSGLGYPTRVSVSGEQKSTAKDEPTRNLNIAASSPLTSGAFHLMQDELTAEFAQTCELDPNLIVANWMSGTSFPSEIFKKLIQIYDSRGQISESGLEHLTKAYLYYGMGNEAIEISQLLPEGNKYRAFLVSLSKILVAPNTAHDLSEIDSILCHEAHLVWKVFSNDSDPIGDYDAFMRSFAALPNAIKTYIGPEVNKRLRALGYLELSSTLLNSLNEQNYKSPSFILERAISDSGANSREALEKIVKGNSNNAQALIEFVQKSVDARAHIDKFYTEQIYSILYQYRESEISIGLQEAYIFSLIGSNGFYPALLEISKHEDTFTPAQLSKIVNVFFIYLNEQEDDVMFLTSAFHFPKKYMKLVLGVERNAFLSRLLKLGFPETVLLLMEENTQDRSPAADAFLETTALLSVDEPRKALVSSLSEEGGDLTNLQKKALFSLGKYERAHIIGIETDNVSSALLARDWELLQDAESNNLKRFALERLRQISDRKIYRLTDAKEALDTSAEKRTLSKDLLNEYLIE